MASDQSDIVYRHASEGDGASDDVWDDSALIEAYDKAVSQIKVPDEISERRKVRQGSGKKKKGKKKQKNSIRSEPPKMNYGCSPIDWKVGDMCRAVYSQDHLTYEAEIMQVNREDGTCLVKYAGYGNEERVNLGDILPSYGHLAKEHLERQKMQRSHQGLEMNGFQNKIPSTSSHSHQHTSHSSSERQFHPPTYNTRYHHESVTSFPPCTGTFAETVPQIPPPPVFPMEEGVVPEDEALAAMLMSWYMSGYHTGFYQGQKQSSRHSCNCRCTHMHR